MPQMGHYVDHVRYEYYSLMPKQRLFQLTNEGGDENKRLLRNFFLGVVNALHKKPKVERYEVVDSYY